MSHLILSSNPEFPVSVYSFPAFYLFNAILLSFMLHLASRSLCNLPAILLPSYLLSLSSPFSLIDHHSKGSRHGLCRIQLDNNRYRGCNFFPVLGKGFRLNVIRHNSPAQLVVPCLDFNQKPIIPRKSRKKPSSLTYSFWARKSVKGGCRRNPGRA